jgi:bacteriocin biosynthesis cyclodehydratase domain-containing protein
MLLPALRRLWRDERTLQLGVDPDRAVVLDEVTPALATVLELLDGRHPLDAVVAEAAAVGVPQHAVEELLAALAECGVVVDAAAGGRPGAYVGGLGPQLSAELAALTLTLPDPSAAVAVLERRRGAAVTVHGPGRAGPVVAALLGAAGVGRVHVATSGIVGAGEAAVGGVLPVDTHRPRASAAAEATSRAAPRVDTRPLPPGRDPDLVVLVDVIAGAGDQAPGLPAGGSALRWAVRRTPHLPVWVRDAVAVIGPLVLPGRTACLACLDLHRSDRDPAWPALVAQLTTGRAATEPAACGAALVGAAASLAAMQVLAHLDGDPPETLGGSLELAEPGAVIRRRTWPPHPDCGCLEDTGHPPSRSPSRPPSRQDRPTAGTMAG